MQYDTHDWHGPTGQSMSYRKNKEYLETESTKEARLLCEIME